uniref:WPP domain-containing protein n=1 Tax=Oryza barthii TaxID=65489 RepID=A0A0D3GM84_9ORYZ
MAAEKRRAGGWGAAGQLARASAHGEGIARPAAAHGEHAVEVGGRRGGRRRRGAASASVEEGIKALQLYSKEVSSRLLDFVKSRSAAAKAAAAAAPSEGDAPAASSESEVVDPQPAE